MHRKLKKKYAEVQLQDSEMKQLEATYNSAIKAALTKNEDAASILRNALELGAAKGGIELNSVSAVRNSNLNNEVVLYEIDLSGFAGLEELATMIYAIESAENSVCWRKLELRVGGRMAESSVAFSGTLGLIQFIGENEVK